MFKFKRKNKKGFTLTELLIVVLVISVLAAVALPSYNRAVERTRAAQGVTTLQSIAKAQVTYNARRGNYTSNMYALPIDLKDKDGKDIEGDTFSDQYFDYTIYGDILSQSIAKRENNKWNYELAIDYATGKLYCTPEDNEICKSLGFDVNTREIPEGSSSGGGGKTVKCKGDTCYLYDGNKVVGKCDKKENGIHKCESSDKNGFYCTETECGEYSDGVVLEDSICSKEWVNKDGTACAKQTFECYKDKGICVTYKDGEEYETCTINKEGNACVTTVLQCNLTGECWSSQDGERISGCSVSNGEEIDYDCAKKYYFSGKACTKEYCIQFDSNGNKLLQCDYASGTCKDVDGKTCKANADFSGCAKDGDSSSDTKVECNDDGCKVYNKDGTLAMGCDKKTGLCTIFDNGVNVGKTCKANETFTGCANKEDHVICNSMKECKVATEVENGTICYKEEKQCKVLKDGKVIDTCTSNDTFNGCAEESGEESGSTKYKCDGKQCQMFDKDGNVISSCSYDNHKCFAEAGFTGTYCYENGSAGKTCETYENGVYKSKCGEKVGCTLYNGEEQVGTCDKPNPKLTACAEEGGEESGSVSSFANNYKCEKSTCTFFDENGNEVATCKKREKEDSCAGPPTSIEDYNGMVCLPIKGLCYTYDKGNIVDACNANDTFTGCAEETSSHGLTCEGFTCTDDWGKTCYSDGKGNCISGKGLELACYKEKGECHWYQDGEEVVGGVCAINDAGDGCKEEEKEKEKEEITFNTNCNNNNAQCLNVYVNGKKAHTCYIGEDDCFAKWGWSGVLTEGSTDKFGNPLCRVYSYQDGKLAYVSSWGECGGHSGGSSN